MLVRSIACLDGLLEVFLVPHGVRQADLETLVQSPLDQVQLVLDTDTIGGQDLMRIVSSTMPDSTTRPATSREAGPQSLKDLEPDPLFVRYHLYPNSSPGKQ